MGSNSVKTFVHVIKSAIKIIVASKLESAIFLIALSGAFYCKIFEITSGLEVIVYLIAIYTMGGTLGCIKDLMINKQGVSYDSYIKNSNKYFWEVLGAYLIISTVLSLLTTGIDIANLIEHFRSGKAPKENILIIFAKFVVVNLLSMNAICIGIYYDADIFDAVKRSFTLLRRNMHISMVFLIVSTLYFGANYIINKNGWISYFGVISSALLLSASILIICVGNFIYLSEKENQL